MKNGIIDSTHTTSTFGLRVIKTTSMKNAPRHAVFFVHVHDEPATNIRKVLGVPQFTNHGPIKSWGPDDYVSVNIEGRGTIRFYCHTMGGPKYPVAKLNNAAENTRNVRVSFYTHIDTVLSKNDKQTTKNTPPFTPANVVDATFEEITETTEPPVILALPAPEPEVIVPPRPIAPNRADFEKSIQYANACKKYKKAVVEWENEYGAGE